MTAYGFVAGLVFSGAFVLAIDTIATMVISYRDKIAAALLYEPIPRDAPVYRHASRP